MERGIEPGSVTEGRPDWWTGARTGELIVGLTVQRMDGPPKLTDTLAQASVQTLTLAVISTRKSTEDSFYSTNRAKQQ